MSDMKNLQQPQDETADVPAHTDLQQESDNLRQLEEDIERMLGGLGVFTQTEKPHDLKQQQPDDLIGLVDSLFPIDDEQSGEQELLEVQSQRQEDALEIFEPEAQELEPHVTPLPSEVEVRLQQAEKADEASTPDEQEPKLVSESTLGSEAEVQLQQPEEVQECSPPEVQAPPAVATRDNRTGNSKQGQTQWCDVDDIPGLAVGSTVNATVQAIRQSADGFEGIQLSLPSGLVRFLHKSQLPGRTEETRQSWMKQLKKGQRLPVEVVAVRQEVAHGTAKQKKEQARREVMVSVRSVVERKAHEALRIGDTVKGVVLARTVTGSDNQHTGWEIQLDNYLLAWIPKSEVQGELELNTRIEAAIFSLDVLPVEEGKRRWPLYKVRVTTKGAERVEQICAQQQQQELQAQAFATLSCGDIVKGTVVDASMRKRDQVHTGWNVRLENQLMAWMPLSESGGKLQEGDSVEAAIMLLQELKPEPGKRSTVSYSVKLTIKNAARERSPKQQARVKAASELVGSVCDWKLLAPVGGLSHAVLKVGELEVRGMVRLFVSNVPNDQMSHEQRRELLDDYLQRGEPLECKVLRLSSDNETLELRWHHKAGEVGMTKPDGPQSTLSVGDVVPVRVSECQDGLVTVEVQTPMGTAYGVMPEPLDPNVSEQVNFVLPDDNN